MNSIYTLTATCPDHSGLISSITNCIASNNGNILNLAQHTSVDLGMFFCRIQFSAPSTGEGGKFFSPAALPQNFQKLQASLT